MHNENFLKRFKLFRVLVVAPKEGEFFRWCRDFDDHCGLCTYEELGECGSGGPPHLVLLQTDGEGNDFLKRKEAMERLRKLRYWQLILFAKDPERPEVQRFAIDHHAFGLHPLPASREDVMKAVAEVLPALMERMQEQTRSIQLQKIVDMGAAQVLAGAGGKPLFANTAAKRLFGVPDAAHLAESIWHTLSPADFPRKEGDVRLIPFRDKRVLVALSGNGEKEHLYTFIPLDDRMDVQSGTFVSRIGFVDTLKDKMAQRIGSDEPLALLAVRISNLHSIVENFGWSVSHSVVKSFGEMMCTHFQPVESCGVWHKDMPALLFTGDAATGLKERLERFVAEIKIFEFEQNITLTADFVLIDVHDEDLNALINLVEKFYTGQLSVADTKGFSCYRSGTGQEVRKEEDLLMQFFTNIMANRLPVKLLNIYKGLPISTPTRILKVEEGKIVVKTEKIQKFVMREERRVVFQSPHLPGDIEAEVHMTDAQRPLAILKKVKMMHTSINNRKHTRVNVTSRLPVSLKVGKNHYSGFVHDISINSIALFFNAGKFAENELRQKRADLSFKLPWENEEGFVNIAVPGEILFNREENGYHKLVVILEPSDVNESYIFDYIYKRQKELIREIKERIGS
ncbi:PilZ domain-containing protein [Hydrogenimonas urashimensis]|uniref:PilZ domain-containing protein n=1 Tax=Hydrogenimonas urashimensis TaxID=2740515 RepID=UPI0019155F3C|nr:PilZ domain-containing protein [Hydrogenimonas urashimensis]